MYTAFGPAPALPSVELNYPTFASTPLPPQTLEETKPEGVFTCYVRNKVGLDADADAAPMREVNINKEELLKLLHLPLLAACREAGLCSTTFKKACRYHGLRKWPYRRSQQNSERVGGERRASLDATNTTATVSQSVDMFRRSSVGEVGVAETAKTTTPRRTPFSFPDDADFVETSMARPDLFSLLEEEFNTASRPNSAAALSSSSAFSAGSKTAPTAPSSSDHDSDEYDAHFWAQPASQVDQPSPLSGIVATHHMPPAPHDDAPFGRMMAPVPRRIISVGAAAGVLEPAPRHVDHTTTASRIVHTASAACWTPPAAPPVSLGVAEGTMMDAVEACLALPLDVAFVRDFCRQD
jgi:hypothetical protein